MIKYQRSKISWVSRFSGSYVAKLIAVWKVSMKVYFEKTAKLKAKANRFKNS